MDSDNATILNPIAAPRPVQIPSLQECCVNTLTRYRQYLGDVGFMDPESLRSVLWHCSPEQLAHIEDETMVGSNRNLEWYTWHLWRRLLKADFGDGGLQAPDLESEQPVDYVPPRGISDEPADYRTLYMHRKAEMEERTAAAKERIAAANQQVQEAKESRKAKMIDKLAPSKRSRCSSGGGGGSGGSRSQASALTSAYLHKPRAGSRSSVMSNPGAQLKLLSELGLVKRAPPRSTTTVRVIKPSPVSSAAVGHSSSLAGAQLLKKATGGQLGRASIMERGRGMHVEAQAPQVAARAAAVAAAAAARGNSPMMSSSPGSSSGGAAAVFSRSVAASGSGVLKAVPVKRPAEGPPGAIPPPLVKSKMLVSETSGGGRSSGGGSGSGQSDPRVMFPRQAPPTSTPGQSKFAVPTVRPPATATAAATSLGPPTQQQQQQQGPRAGSSGMRSSGGQGVKAFKVRPSEDL